MEHGMLGVSTEQVHWPRLRWENSFRMYLRE